MSGNNVALTVIATVVGAGVIGGAGYLAYKGSTAAGDAKREADEARRALAEINNRPPPVAQPLPAPQTPASPPPAAQQAAQQAGGGLASVLIGGAALATGLGGLVGMLGQLF
jgi:hypothetical protein